MNFLFFQRIGGSGGQEALGLIIPTVYSKGYWNYVRSIYNPVLQHLKSIPLILHNPFGRRPLSTVNTTMHFDQYSYAQRGLPPSLVLSYHNKPDWLGKEVHYIGKPPLNVTAKEIKENVIVETVIFDNAGRDPDNEVLKAIALGGYEVCVEPVPFISNNLTYPSFSIQRYYEDNHIEPNRHPTKKDMYGFYCGPGHKLYTSVESMLEAIRKIDEKYTVVLNFEAIVKQLGEKDAALLVNELI